MERQSLLRVGSRKRLAGSRRKETGFEQEVLTTLLRGKEREDGFWNGSVRNSVVLLSHERAITSENYFFKKKKKPFSFWKLS